MGQSVNTVPFSYGVHYLLKPADCHVKHVLNERSPSFSWQFGDFVLRPVIAPLAEVRDVGKGHIQNILPFLIDVAAVDLKPRAPCVEVASARLLRPLREFIEMEMHARIRSEINESARCESGRSRRCRRTLPVPR